MHHGGEAVAPCLRQLASGPSDHHYLIPTKHDSSFRRNMVISSRVRLYCLALTEAIRLTANIMVQTEVVDQGRPPVAIWPAVSAPPPRTQPNSLLHSGRNTAGSNMAGYQ